MITLQIVQLLFLLIVAVVTSMVYLSYTVVKPQSRPKTITYRVRGVPPEWNEQKLQAALATHFGISVAVNVNSICKSICKKTQVGTAVLEESLPKLKIPPCLELDSNFLGLSVLYAPLEQHHEIDVIIVPGLGGHAFGSFKERGGEHMWPRDSLPLNLTSESHKSPIARIITYGYDSKIEGSDSVQSIGDIAKSFQSSLLQLVRSGDEKPIVFVGHSMGGLVIKEALILLSQSTDSDDITLFRAARGIAFFGVPHAGMKIESILDMAGDKPNRPLISGLNGDNSYFLTQQLPRFNELLYNEGFNPRIRVVYFYETKMSHTAQKNTGGIWEMNGPKALLVPTLSASPQCKEKHHPIACTHSEMVKFGPWDDEWLKVLVHLQGLVHQVRTDSRDKEQARIRLEIEKIQQEAEKAVEDCHKSFGVMNLGMSSSRGRLPMNRLEGTCEWLLKGSEFRKWIGTVVHQDENPLSVLVLKGKPGSGKSMAMRAALDECATNADGHLNDTATIGFFFDGWSGSNGNDQSEATMYKSLLLQLIAKLDPQRLLDLKHEILKHQNEDNPWSISRIQDAVYLVLAHLEFKKLFIFLDALDGCDGLNESTLFEFFEKMHRCASSMIIRVCVSSHAPLNDEHQQDMVVIDVSGQNKSDINKLIVEKLGYLRLSRPQIFMKIVSKLSDRASNIFLWADLVVEHIIKQHTGAARSDQELLNLVDHVPEGLVSLFQHLLHRIPPDDRVEACDLFLLIRISKRPLTAHEVKSMLECSKGTNQKPFDLSQVDIETRIQLISRGLVECQPAYSTPAPTVQFIHKSFADFLDGAGLSTLNGRFAENPIGQFHLGALRLCMRIISYKIESRNSEDKSSFLPYAAQFWMTHAREGDGNVEEDPKYSELLGECDSLGAKKVFEIFREFDRYESYTHYGDGEEVPNTGLLEPDDSLVVLLAFEGCTQLVLQHLKTCQQCMSPNGRPRLERAFLLAAHRGFRATAETILDTTASVGAAINIDAAPKNMSALYVACLKGKTETVDFLMERGADPSKSCDQPYAFPFHAAAAHDEANVLAAILRHKRKDRSAFRRLLLVQSNDGHNVFHHVVLEGRKKVLEWLLYEARDIIVEALGQTTNRGMTAYGLAIALKEYLEKTGRQVTAADASTLDHAIKELEKVMKSNNMCTTSNRA